MTSRERVFAAMAQQQADRVPVGFWFHFTGEKTRGQACVQAHLDYYNHSDVDVVKIMCDGYFDYPNPVAKAVKKPSDWYALKPLGPDSPFITQQVERAKAVRKGLRRDMCVLYNVFAPFSYLRFGTSDALVMAHLKEDPAAVQYALDVVAQDAATLSRLLITQAGVDGLYYCLQGGELARFTAQQYRSWIAPGDLAVLNHANVYSQRNVLHLCGWAGEQNRLEIWRDYPACVVNWAVFVENMDLKRGREYFHHKTVLGGFDNRPGGVLCCGTKEDVMRQTHQVIDQAGPVGLILGADCTLPADIDPQRLNWVAQAAAEHR